MNDVRRSTLVAIAVFLVASVSYVLVRPEDTPLPESSPIPVFVVTTQLTETTRSDQSVTSGPATETTLPSADAPTDDTEQPDADSAATTAVATTGTTR